MITFAAKKMIVFPNCKINLGLNILTRRADGYHNLNTLFYPLQLADCLEVIPSRTSESRFSTSGLPIPGEGSTNLCEKALLLMQQNYHVPPAEIHLHKIIPIGSGLGGGSADAAFTLTTLNRLFKKNIPDSELLHIAATLGSDCAFFLHNTPCLATGRGEILQPVTFSLKGYHLLLVIPPVHVSTREAFAGIQPKKPTHELSDIILKDISLWKELMVNDFEPGIFKLYPSLGIIKENLYDMGAAYASMSGSGSSIYGIFKEKPALPENLFKDCFIWEEVLTV